MDYYRSLDASTLDPDFPTVFELLSARELQSLIRPSLRYIIVHYAQRNPHFMLKLANWFDEVYLAVFGTVEYSYLLNWNASFTERFYGLKRTNLLAHSVLHAKQSVPRIVEKQRRLTRRQVLLSLFAAVLVPYLKEKCEARYDVLKGRYAFNPPENPSPNATLAEKLAFHADMALLKLFPYYLLCENLSAVVFMLSYLFHRSDFSSLTDFIVGFRYSRLGQVDYAQNTQRPPEHFGERFTPANLLRAGLSFTNYTLPSALFVIKFLEWWNSSNFAKKLNKTGPPLDAPSAGAEIGAKGCPLCHKEMQTPTVLESGVVYCYKCIFDHLQSLKPAAEPRCPASNKPLLLTTFNAQTKEWQPGGLRRLLF